MEDTRKNSRAYAVLQKMFRDRSYAIEKEYEAADFNERVLTGQCVLQASVTHAGQAYSVQAFFPLEPKLSVKAVRMYRDAAIADGVARVLLVCIEGLTHYSAKELAEHALKKAPGEFWGAAAVAQQCPVFEVFSRKELMFQATDSVLVPQHVILTADEKAAFLRRFNCTDAQVPRMLPDEGLVRYYGLESGTVVRFMRCIGTLEPHPYWRIVV